jgi:Zn-finger nucleic acid-binding protein
VGPLEIDRCAACGGIWFDAGEIKQLRGLADDQELRGTIAHLIGEQAVAAAVAGDDSLACPVCTLRMTRQHHEDAPGVVIDRCRQHGTWLDHGEVARLLQLATQVDATRLREREEMHRPKKASWLSAILDLFD